MEHSSKIKKLPYTIYIANTNGWIGTEEVENGGAEVFTNENDEICLQDGQVIKENFVLVPNDPLENYTINFNGEQTIKYTLTGGKAFLNKISSNGRDFKVNTAYHYSVENNTIEKNDLRLLNGSKPFTKTPITSSLSVINIVEKNLSKETTHFSTYIPYTIYIADENGWIGVDEVTNGGYPACINGEGKVCLENGKVIESNFVLIPNDPKANYTINVQGSENIKYTKAGGEQLLSKINAKGRKFNIDSAYIYDTKSQTMLKNDFTIVTGLTSISLPTKSLSSMISTAEKDFRHSKMTSMNATVFFTNYKGELSVDNINEGGKPVYRNQDGDLFYLVNGNKFIEIDHDFVIISNDPNSNYTISDKKFKINDNEINLLNNKLNTKNRAFKIEAKYLFDKSTKKLSKISENELKPVKTVQSFEQVFKASEKDFTQSKALATRKEIIKPQPKNNKVKRKIGFSFKNSVSSMRKKLAERKLAKEK